MSVAVIVNRNAKQVREDPELVPRLRSVVGSAGYVAATSSREELLQALRSAQQQSVDLLSWLGGDGTHGFILTALRELQPDPSRWPRIAPIRGGTMNTVATSLGVPRTSPEQAVRRLVEAERGTRELAERRLSTLDAAGRLGFLFGTGVARTFLEEYYRRGNSHPTPTDAVRTLARMSAGVVVRGPRARRLLAPEQFALELDEVRWPSRPYTLILAATIQDVGLGFRPFYRVTQGDGRLQLLGLHGSPSRILVRLPRAFRGRPLGADCAVDALVERATLHASTADVVRFFVDGDLHESRSPLGLTTGPEVRLAWAR